MDMDTKIAELEKYLEGLIANKDRVLQGIRDNEMSKDHFRQLTNIHLKKEVERRMVTINEVAKQLEQLKKEQAEQAQIKLFN